MRPRAPRLPNGVADFGIIDGLRAAAAERSESVLTAGTHRRLALEIAAAVRAFNQTEAARFGDFGQPATQCPA